MVAGGCAGAGGAERRRAGLEILPEPLEELLEVLGVVVFIHTLLQYLAAEVGEVRRSFRSREPLEKGSP